MGYTIEKPRTSYTTEKECPYKFSNTDIAIDTAVANITKNEGRIIFPNSKLLAKAVMKEKWWGGNVV